MIVRFSLYSALKNQRFFESFLVLALLEKGLTFTQIGTLIALRELAVITMEIPSGAIADVTGRRRVLLIAVALYAIAFAFLGLDDSIPWLVAALPSANCHDHFGIRLGR